MRNPLRRLVRHVGGWYCKAVCRREYGMQTFLVNERIIEYGFVFRCLLRCAPVTVLDVGTGTSALPHMIRNCGLLVTAIDNVRDYWPRGMVNRHYYVINDNILNTRLTDTFDFITCISVLEHIPEHNAAIESMLRLLRPGGHMALTFPYNEHRYIDNVYALPGAGYGQKAPYVCQVYSRAKLSSWCERYGLKIIEQEYWEFFTGEFWTFGERLYPPQRVTVDQKHHVTCLLLRAP